MLECLLVVAMSLHGDVISRSFSTIRDVPEPRAERIMAIEAGRGFATQANLRRYPRAAKSAYGYDCGEGWVDQGLTRRDVFGRR